MKIKIVEPGFEGMNGHFGDVEFVNGVSKEDVTKVQAQRLGNLVRIECEDGTNPSSSQLVLDSGVVPMDENYKAHTVPPESQTNAQKSYTRKELEAIADAAGIEGLRKISDPLGLKSRSIANLVEQILTATKSADAPAPVMLVGSSTQPSNFEFNGKAVSLGEVVAAAHAKSGKTVADWNAQPEEEREAAIAAIVAEMTEPAPAPAPAEEPAAS